MINGIQVIDPYTGVVRTLDVSGPIQITQGEILRVSVSVEYKTGMEDDYMHLDACLGPTEIIPGQWTMCVAHGDTDVPLNIVTDFTPISANIDVKIGDGILWGILAARPGTYDLIVMVNGDTDIVDRVSQCVTVVEKAGFLDTIMAIVPLFLLIMIMGMMAPMMKGGEEVEGGKVSESEGGEMTELVTQTEKTGMDKMMGGMMTIMIMMIGLSLIGATPSVACTEGATKCVGYDLYQCDGAGNWVLVQQNSTECGYVPVAAYGCPYCSESFATLQELIMHVSLVHPEMPPIQEVDIEWD